jgi:hypothetical protein
MSAIALSIGDETADPGDSELVMLAVDSVFLSVPPVAPGIAIGAVAEARSCAPAPALLSTMVGVLGDWVLDSVVASCAGRSV